MAIKFNLDKVYDTRHIICFTNEVEKLLFPDFWAAVHQKGNLTRATHLFLHYISKDKTKCETFFSKLSELKEKLEQDVVFTFDSDPACDCYEEIILTYPGYKAVLYHRIAHELNLLGLHIVARIISEEAHKQTGIDIHPGATIGAPICIDHGTGIVIGETTVIGHHCKIYQGVTLGALSTSRGQLIADQKRHPTIGDYVTIYAGASVLGGDVTVGDNVVIGSNVFLIESIPSNSKVKLQTPQLILIKKGE